MELRTTTDPHLAEIRDSIMRATSMICKDVAAPGGYLDPYLMDHVNAETEFGLRLVKMSQTGAP